MQASWRETKTTTDDYSWKRPDGLHKATNRPKSIAGATTAEKPLGACFVVQGRPGSFRCEPNGCLGEGPLDFPQTPAEVAILPLDLRGVLRLRKINPQVPAPTRPAQCRPPAHTHARHRTCKLAELMTGVLEVAANGLPLWSGQQLAVDTTLVSPCPARDCLAGAVAGIGRREEQLQKSLLRRSRDVASFNQARTVFLLGYCGLAPRLVSLV